MSLSAYRRDHSKETSLLKVHSDIAEARGEGSMTALLMFDLSAAFDIIDRPFRICLWHQGKGLNLGKVVPRQQISVCFNCG